MNLLKFRPKTPTEPPAAEMVKYGLYPLGVSDVVMSLPTFDVVTHMLANGTPEDRLELAAVLRRMYQGVYTGVLGE